jgi:hypothetical protein
MSVVEFEQGGRTYQIETSYDSNNIHSLNLLRDKVTISTDRLTGEKVFVAWEKISIMRIIS